VRAAAAGAEPVGRPRGPSFNNQSEDCPMKRLLSAAALAVLACGAALAQTLADGEVRKIDKAKGRITLKHGEIKHMDMPPMTMVFHVKDPKSLEALAVGDKVRFAVDKIDGQYTVTAISKAP
jgi:Cu/Ag efflux protein CusF